MRHSAAQVALAWVMGRAGVGATRMGASRAAQVSDNGAAFGLVLSGARLDGASAPEQRMLYGLFTDVGRAQVVFGSRVRGWQR